MDNVQNLYIFRTIFVHMKETEQYTYEKFKEDFEDAQTPEAKQEAI